MSLIARTIFAVPPFPGANPAEIVRVGASDEARNVTAQALLAAFRKHRVGGEFWLPSNSADSVMCNPWMQPKTEQRFCADDGRALLAAIAGHKVLIDGEGAFSELGRVDPESENDEVVLQRLVHKHLLAGLSYHDPFTGEPTDPLTLIDILRSWRDLIEANRPLAAAFGFAHWKQDTVAPLLWGGQPTPFRPARTAELDHIPDGTSIAVWKARVPKTFLNRLEAGPWKIVEVEDGFIRSTGLGADCVPPLSIVVDDLGVHYDPLRPNRLEKILNACDFSPAELTRARRLREWLVREGVSKYGAGGGAALLRKGGDRRHLLVVGQVEDDRSVQFGGGTVQSNQELLRRVREHNPDAWLIYRPHPDVEAGHRRGAISSRAVLNLADEVDPGNPISALIAMVDEVHVITSLAGFEALLQDKSVTTYGTPFFAGWGLTHDLGSPSSRRGVPRSVDQLVAAVLLHYPRYLDPVTNLPGTPETLVMRLLSGVQRQNDTLVPMRRLVGLAKRTFARFVGIQ